MTDPLSLPSRFNAADHFILPNLAPHRAGRPYLHCGAETLTFGALHRRANRFAGVLRRLGVTPGRRVALLLPEGLDFPVCFWGALRAGAVPVPLNPALTPGGQRHFIHGAGAAVLVADAALWPRLAPVMAGVGGRAAPITLLAGYGGEASGGGGTDLPALDDLLAGESDDFDTVPMRPDDPAFWLYTSGSTGPPKPAVHRHRDMVHVAKHYLGRVLHLRPDDLAFSAPKMFFAYGLGNSLYFPLATGSAAVILPGPATAAACLELLARWRPTVFYGTPGVYAAMLDRVGDWLGGRGRPPARLPRLEHLRLALSGGEALPPGLFHRWRRQFGHPILDGLGSTEALHFYLANTPGHHRPGSAGRLVPGYEARLVDGDGEDVPESREGRDGELWLRGGPVAGCTDHPGAEISGAGNSGAAGSRERAGGQKAGGWLATGDRLRRDSEGYYYYRGRVDDLFKVGGSWVAPAEVEAVLLEHPRVAECAVVGMPGPDGLARAVAHVVLRAGSEAGFTAESALLDHAAARLPAFKVPAEIRNVPALPKTASGKTRRFLLHRRAGGLPAAEGEHHF